MKFNSKTVGRKTTNLAGGKAYSFNAEQELATLALTSFNEKKFYESASEQNERLVNLSEKVSKEFLGNLAVFVRKEYNMRSVSHVIAAELARLHKGQKEVIKAVIQRPDDMNEIVAYYGNKYGKPIPNSIKKAIREKLPEFNVYKLSKYKCQNKEVKLVDLFNLVHPKPTNTVQEKSWGDLLNGKLNQPETWEVLISTAKNDTERTKAWEKLITEEKLGYMAMLRNLRNFEKYGISENCINIVCAYLTNEENVKKSKQLPFRFFSAYREATLTKLKDAVSIAMDIAVNNVPAFDGKTAVVVDVSGSMTSAMSSRSTVSYADISRLFGCAMWKKNPNNTDFYAFDDKVYKYNNSSRTPLIDMINQIQVNGGATYLFNVFNAFKQNNLKYDRVIIFSDMQCYEESSYCGGTGSQQAFSDWKGSLGITPKLYSVDLSGNGASQFGEVNLIAGWSEKIFDMIKLTELDKNALVNTIKTYEIRKER